MNRILALILFLYIVTFSLTSPALAAPCGVGTLDDYIALGAGGCTVGDQQFAGFSYQASSSGGPGPVQARGITVTPYDTPDNPALDFSTLWSAAANQHVDSILRFTVTTLPGGDLLNDLGLLQAGNVVSGSGIAAVGETACLGDTFANSCAGGTVVSLQTFMTESSADLVDHLVFASPVSFIDVVKDIGVTGGPQGFALLSLVENSFSETPMHPVPEASTLLLLGTGMVGLAWRTRRHQGGRA